MAKPRDYAAEYQRRIERGRERGLSRSQARGHPRTGESAVRGAHVPKYDKRLEEGLRAIRNGKSLKEAGKRIHADPTRLRNYIQQAEVAEKRGGRWRIGQDDRVRHLQVYSGGKAREIDVQGFDAAQRVSRYMAAVKEFLRTNDASILEPYKGEAVIDRKGKRYVFETHPNTLYRLDAEGVDSYESIYRIVV